MKVKKVLRELLSIIAELAALVGLALTLIDRLLG